VAGRRQDPRAGGVGGARSAGSAGSAAAVRHAGAVGRRGTVRPAGRKTGGTPGARSPYVPLTRYFGRSRLCPRPLRASEYSASPLLSGTSPGGSEMMERVTEASPRFMARIAGVLYLLNVVTALFAFSGSGAHWMAVASGHIATACYIAVTVLFYSLFKPVSRS